MAIFENFERQNLIQIYTKTQQIAPFKKKLSEDHVPSPPSKEHCFAKSQKE